MAKQIINNKSLGETGRSSRMKINSNFTENYNSIEALEKLNIPFNSVSDLQDYAINNPTAYVGQQCVVKGNPSSVYVINTDKTLTPIASIKDINEMSHIKDSEPCFIRFEVDCELYNNSINAKYLFWSSSTTDYCIYNPLSDGWDGNPPRILGRTSIPLTDIPLDIFDVEGSVDDGYIKIINKDYGKCKSPFSIETLVDVIYAVTYRDYTIVDFSNNSKINKHSVEGLEANLTTIENNITTINESLVPILQPQETFDYTTYTYNLNSLTAIWEQDWLVLDLLVKPTYDIRNFKSIIEIDNRFVNITPVFALPIYTTIPILKLYVRDTDGVLSKYNNLGRIFIQFDLYKHTTDINNEHVEFKTLEVFEDTVTNMMIAGGNEAHDYKCKLAVQAAIPGFTGDIIIPSMDIIELDGSGIPAGSSNIVKYSVKYNYDIVALPVVSSASDSNDLPYDASYSANPNLLITIAHKSNSNVEFNFFDNETEFFDGVILCGVVVTDFIFDPITTGYDFDPITHKGLFHYSYGRGLEFVVDFAILYPNTVYNSSYLTLEPITLIPSESYATSIIAAQLKSIKLATKSTWLEVRLAARATASNNGVWDKYKGFGHINVDAAIAYIKANYTEQSIEIGKRYSQEKGYSDKLQYEHIYKNTPIPKRLIEEKLSTKADLEDGKVIHSQIPSNVLLSDGSVQMGTQVQSILSNQYLVDSYTNTSINIEGDLRSIFNIGNYIKAYGAGVDYYMTILTVTYDSVQNYTKLTFVSQGTISYFFIIKISNIPIPYTPVNDQDISTKAYSDTKQEIVIFDNTIEQQTLINTDKILIQDTIGNFKWISFANLKKQIGLQVGQKYLGGTIIKLNEDNNSGVIASYFEFENTYEYAMINYGTTGTYVKDGYSNWRLPNITELDLIFQYSKSERDIIGDVNGDGIVNQLDKVIIEQATNLFIDNTHPDWNTKWFKADINGDGIIDIDDATLIENLINTNQGSMYQYKKYLAYDISDINPITSCKGYIAPVLTISGGVISQTPHVLTELLKTDKVGIRLVRNF